MIRSTQAPATTNSSPPANHLSRLTIACHLPASNLYDEGFEHALDVLQGRGGVNTLFLNAFGASQPLTDVASADRLADHGVPLPRLGEPYTRVWFERPDNLLRAVGLDLIDARVEPNVKYAGRDVYADLAGHRKAHGLKVHARILEYALSAITGWEELREVDYEGNRTPLPCWRNPRYREFWAQLAAFLVSTYDLDGFHFGAERNGPLTQSLIWSGNVRAGCFCEDCLRAAREKGIDTERARRGFRVMDQLKGRAESKEPFFLKFLRHLTHYPEILAWERLWTEGRNQAWAGMANRVHQAKRIAKVGWHIWQYTASLDFIARASLDYGEWVNFSDYVKPCLYQDVQEQRFNNVVFNRYENILFRQVDPALARDFIHQILGHGMATPEFAGGRVAPEYVGSHCAIAREEIDRAGGEGKCELWAGLGLNIPGSASDAEDREILERSAQQALEHGADGLVWCREYQEMSLESLEAARRGAESACAARKG